LADIFYAVLKDPLPFPVLASHIRRSVSVASFSLWYTIPFSKFPPFERSQVWIEQSFPIDIRVDFHDAVDEIIPISCQSSKNGGEYETADRVYWLFHEGADSSVCAHNGKR
jgi:hypothetical protein